MNIDSQVVEGFGDEWQRFDQSNLSPTEYAAMAAVYFPLAHGCSKRRA
jgi:hypothetical protein